MAIPAHKNASKFAGNPGAGTANASAIKEKIGCTQLSAVDVKYASPSSAIVKQLP